MPRSPFFSVAARSGLPALLSISALFAVPAKSAEPIAAPVDAIRIPVENIDGALLIKASLFRSEQADTSGLLVLDTGADYLALDPSLMLWLGIADRKVDDMTFAPRPLRRLQVGGLQQDVVGPVLSIDVSVIQQVTDRKVLGLLGQQPLGSFAVRIDYRSDSLALIPIRRDGISATVPRRATAADLAASGAAVAMARNASRVALGDALSVDAVGLPFDLEGDGKILVKARLGDIRENAGGESLTLVLDTGATKTVIFADALTHARSPMKWKQLHGLSAPTLYGTEKTYLARVPTVTLVGGSDQVSADDVDVAVMASPLAGALSQAVHQPVAGLLGHSFLRRFRVTIDYPHRLLWLEPLDVSRDQRRYEYSHVGIQVERHEGALRVVAVAEGSPAAIAGVRAGDEFLAVDGTSAAALDVVSLSRKLEGPPGSRVSLCLSRGGRARSYRLPRRELL